MPGYYTKDEIAAYQEAYKLLECDAKADPEAIRKNYLALIKTWHPDKWAHDDELENQATEKIQNINAAFDLISWAPLRYRKQMHEPGLRLEEEDEGDKPEEDVKPRKYTSRYKDRKRRHATPEEASAFRKRSSSMFRFSLGFIGSIIPILLLKFNGLTGMPFFMACLLLPFICGFLNMQRDMVNDDGGGDGLF